jgi:allantoin racemase
MATRILSQNVLTIEGPWVPGGYAAIGRGMRKIYEKVLHTDTTVQERYIPRSTVNTTSSFLELLNNAEVIRGIIEGEREGYDVAVIACGNDPGLYQAREAVNIPVVGTTQAAIFLACQLGTRFALITLDPKCIPLLEHNIRLYGLEDRAIARKPVRIIDSTNWQSVFTTIPTWFTSVEYTRQQVIPRIEKVAKECIEDGAEVICTACAYFGCLTLANYNKVTGTEVPVIDNVVAGIKIAELLGDLRRTVGISTSKHLTFQSLPTEMRDELAKPFFR